MTNMNLELKHLTNYSSYKNNNNHNDDNNNIIYFKYLQHFTLFLHLEMTFEKWRAILASVGGVLSLVACLCGSRASVDGMSGVLAWVACQRG